MKRVIKSANFWGYNYRYEVHWISPQGTDKLLGGSNDIKEAERIAINQLNELMKNPWETKKNKALFIQNCYIYDSKTDSDATTMALEDIEDGMLSELGVAL